MKHSTGKPTKAEAQRMAALKEMPCVACSRISLRLMGGVCGPTEVHHLIRANRRLGHSHTIPLGSYHHRGVRPMNFTAAGTALIFGPSLANGSKAFRAHFGSDDFLLALTNEKLERRNG